MITSVTVGTSETEVLAAPTIRPYELICISNTGSQEVFIKVTGDADALTAANGIPLASKAAFVIDQDKQRRLIHHGVTAICASGSTTVSVQAF